ncbi:hypothetical protein D3C75_670520 [compost metagenome]
MNKSKRLPFNTKPIIQTYSSHSKLLSILSTNEEYLPWFHSNYTQLSCKKDFHSFHGVPLDFFIDIRQGFNYYLNNPCLFIQTVHKEIIDAEVEDIVDFVIRCLDRDYYLDLYLNEFFVPGRPSYGIEFYVPGVKHLYHDNLIVGYDLSTQTFEMLGHNPGFTNTSITFEDFRLAYRHCTPESWHKCMYLYKLSNLRDGYSSPNSYRFDLEYVKQSLIDYVSSIDISIQYGMLQNRSDDLVFGLQVYDALINNLLTGHYWEDIRPLNLLYEHKKCMRLRVEYMYKLGHLNSDYFNNLLPAFQELETHIETLKNAQMRYILRKNGDTEPVINGLKQAKQWEETAICQLIQKLSY